MSDKTFDGTPMEEPLARLEQQFIREYLTLLGEDYHTLLLKNDEPSKALLSKAALYASERLSEIESRSHYINDLHQKD
jgi:hypothetical protein